MTSILARRTCGIKILCSSVSHRIIHASAIAYKRKGKVIVDDLFSEDTFVEEELVKGSSTVYTAKPSSPAPSVQPEVLSSQLQQATIRKPKKRLALSPSVRLERLNGLLSFTERRIGRVPELATPLVRRRSWLNMLDLVASEEQMQRIVDLFPAYKNGAGEFPIGFAEAFAKRCEQLSCPQLSLQVFGNFAKYQLALTLPAGRWLIHSLYIQHPTSSTLLAASFYPAYGLPHISEDLPSAAMVAAACYNHKHKTDETIKVAEALLPNIRKMWTNEEKIGTAKSLDEARVNQWVSLSLRRLNSAVQREKGEVVVPPKAVPTKIIIERASSTTHLNVGA